ncbi:UPF0481 protein [Acorus calamus]|uniref:UPF0481 protein n=1 Tax=Acorus calamus TaxID=4465 RepID=A0AAV9CYV7_ACOCL|nr:UPF0481 protein [Acorus calamus]
MDPLQASSAHQLKLTPHRAEIEVKINDLGKSMEDEMTKKTQSNQWRREPCSIFRVPTYLRWSSFRTYDPKKMRNGPYDPRFISIGPFHRENPQLQPMEEFKWHALRFFLSNNPKKTTLHECLVKMKELIPRARSCYSETFQISDEDFAKMMVLDGCIVLFILNERLEDIVLLPDQQQPAENNGAIAPAWPIFRSLVADLLLLENQIPFFILDELFKLLLLSTDDEKTLANNDDEEKETLANVALGTLIRAYPGKKYFFEYEPKDETKIHHLLHLFYLAIALPLVPDESTVPAPEGPMMKFKKMMSNLWQRGFLPSYLRSTNRASASDGPMMTKFKKMMGDLWRPLRPRPSASQSKGIPSVTELKKAGVKFKPKNNANSFLDVTFQKGVMEIPTLILYPYTQTTLRNIIAFEQCLGGDKRHTHISHYVIMMAFLIGDGTDISTLMDEEIVINWLGSQEEVLGVFKQLRSEVVDTSNDKFATLYNEVNSYRQLQLHKYREILCSDYFGNPWSIISVIAAIVLFVLTFLQTYYAVYTTYHPNS